MAESEVAKLRRRIDEELQSMRWGLSGLARGTALHQFIQARMNNLGVHQDELARHVGEEAALDTVCRQYIKTMEEHEKQDPTVDQTIGPN